MVLTQDFFFKSFKSSLAVMITKALVPYWLRKGQLI